MKAFHGKEISINQLEIEKFMSNIRIIARLDIKGPNLIKGIHLEGFRVIGAPEKHAIRYYENGIDEIIFMDMVASLFGRNNLKDVVKRTAQRIFIPLTVGGGIRSTEDVREILRSGADKVAINTAAVKHPELITKISRIFGSQCMVLSIEAKKNSEGGWEALTDNGREHSGLDVLEWSQKGVELGAGEILLTSVDKEGTCKGFDVNLVRAVASVVEIPVIAAGGMGETDHLVKVVQDGMADAVSIASVLHYEMLSLDEIREAGLQAGLKLRIP
jgi:cyclase